MLTITDEQIKNYSVRTAGLLPNPRRVAVNAIKNYVFAALGVHMSDGEEENYILLKVCPDFDTPFADGFIMKPNGKNVEIICKTQRAAVYAAFAFAEEYLGVKYLTADCEIVPKLKSFGVFEYEYKPLFDMRTYLVGDTFESLADQDFMAKVRIKDVYTEPDDAHGGKVGVYGRNVSHNFHFYVPFEKYGKSHPEFYRHITVVGEEMTTIDITNGLNEDGTINPDVTESVIKIVVDEMYKDVVSHPEASVFTLTQEDGSDYFDDDNNRRLSAKYKRSGLLVRFCNAVIRAVNERAKRELGKTVKLMTFAYDYAKDAPVKYENGKAVPIDESVVADENLIIQFALFSNAAYDYFDEKQDEEILRAMKEWKTIAKEFWFWAYDIAFNNYFGFYDSFKNIEANVKGFKNYGITYLCMQGSNDSRKNWQCNIRAYAYRQLMNGSKYAVNRLIDEYIDGYYSVAAESVKEVIKLFSDNYAELLKAGKDVRFTTFGNFTNGENNPYNMLLKAVKAIEEGEAAVRAKYDGNEREVYLKRLAAVKTTPLDLLYLNYYYYFPNGNESERAQACENFVSAARYAEIDRAREHYSLERYVDFTESEVKIPVETQG